MKLYDIRPQVDHYLDARDAIIYRRFNSWAVDPLPPLEDFANVSASERRQYKYAVFIDCVCEALSRLPTIRAMIAECPQILRVRIYGANLGKDARLGSYGGNGRFKSIEINMNQTVWSNHGLFLTHLTTMAHELRHAYQDFMGFSRAKTDLPLRHSIQDQLKIVRIEEADATAFHFSIAYEIGLAQKNFRAFEYAAAILPDVANAYSKAAGRKEGNHWNGLAAQASFEAYFRSSNRRFLEKHDMSLCKDFAIAVAHTTPTPVVREDMRKTYVVSFTRLLEGFAYTQAKKLYRRREYRPHTYGNVLDYISESVIGHIKNFQRAHDDSIQAIGASRNRRDVRDIKP